jgi:hypothetical protein
VTLLIATLALQSHDCRLIDHSRKIGLPLAIIVLDLRLGVWPLTETPDSAHHRRTWPLAERLLAAKSESLALLPTVDWHQ